MKIDLLPKAALILRTNGQAIQANNAASSLLDIPAGTISGWNITQALSDEKAVELHAFLCSIAPQKPERLVTHLTDGDKLRAIALDASRLPDGSLLLLIEDITAVQELQERIDSQQALQNAVLEHIEDGIIACDTKGQLSMFNRAARELHGLRTDIPPHELWVEHYRLFHPEDENGLQPVDIPLIKALNGRRLKNEEMTIVRADGKKRHVQVSGQPMSDKNGRQLGAVISLHDITDLKKTKEQLREIAYLDPLTGTPNRRLFHNLLSQAVRRAKRSREFMAVLFLDLDNFKHVNDELGHETGDRLLKEVAAALKNYLRESDIICRWGGDEFVVALPKLGSEADASLVAAKVGAAVRSVVVERYSLCRISTSIGIALYPDHAEIADQLIRAADKAMYTAKQQGKDRYCFALPEHIPQKKAIGQAPDSSMTDNV
jgi:diguanylate cyclase (GGDEF)-like protein/PAS domain S-box-containing protein